MGKCRGRGRVGGGGRGRLLRAEQNILPAAFGGLAWRVVFHVLAYFFCGTLAKLLYEVVTVHVDSIG